jgi:pimeloyl-ACP methyl ester carboxylesterase
MPATVALAHQALGSGAPLLVLHGLFGSGTNWRRIARGLEDCRTTHLLDARNHGASPHAADMDYRLLAADVAAFMDAQEIPRADVIGHSMGGKTAMRLALDAPQRVARLMVVDIAPDVSTSDHGALIRALRALPVERFQRRGDADTALAASVPDAGLRAFLLQSLAAGETGLRWRLNLEAIERCMPDLLAFDVDDHERFEGETLFLRGGASDYVREVHRERIRRHFPNAVLRSLEGAGHWLHAERPDEFLALAREFLSCS